MIDPEYLPTLVWYSTLLLLKLATFPMLVGFNRVRRGIFVAEEDVVYFGSADSSTQRVKFDDVVIERIRRSHLNDLENIVPFLGLIWLYCSTSPTAATALLVCRVFTGARVAHTISYLGHVPQPARGLAWGVGVMCNLYIGVSTLMHHL